jgi:hypothetical protein
MTPMQAATTILPETHHAKGEIKDSSSTRAA